MFSRDMKHMISEKIQTVLQQAFHDELPDYNIQFLIHIDGKDILSWANITNQCPTVENEKVPMDLCRNRTTGG